MKSERELWLEKRVEELERLNRHNVAQAKADAEAAEAELARCVDVLADFTWDWRGDPTCWPNRDRVDAALAAAKGV